MRSQIKRWMRGLTANSERRTVDGRRRVSAFSRRRVRISGQCADAWTRSYVNAAGRLFIPIFLPRGFCVWYDTFQHEDDAQTTQRASKDEAEKASPNASGTQSPCGIVRDCGGIHFDPQCRAHFIADERCASHDCGECDRLGVEFHRRLGFHE